MEDFLRGMVGMFAFVGSRFRLEVDGDEYFVDLLLFYRRLPKELKGQLPSPQEIARLLEAV